MKSDEYRDNQLETHRLGLVSEHYHAKPKTSRTGSEGEEKENSLGNASSGMERSCFVPAHEGERYPINSCQGKKNRPDHGRGYHRCKRSLAACIRACRRGRMTENQR